MQHPRRILESVGMFKDLWLATKALWIAARHAPTPPTAEQILEMGKQPGPPMSYPPPWVIWAEEPRHGHRL